MFLCDRERQEGPVLRRGLFTQTALILCALQACSWQQVYSTGQAWQKQECNKLLDAQERNRCMASTSTSYEEYQRQSDAARGAR